MDAITFAIAEAREEELLSQREAIEAQLRVLQSMMNEYREANPPPADTQKAHAASRRSRFPAIRDAVKSILLKADGPMFIGTIIENLSELGLVDGTSKTDRAYTRATLQRMTDIVVRENARWRLIQPQE